MRVLELIVSKRQNSGTGEGLLGFGNELCSNLLVCQGGTLHRVRSFVIFIPALKDFSRLWCDCLKFGCRRNLGIERGIACDGDHLVILEGPVEAANNSNHLYSDHRAALRWRPNCDDVERVAVTGSRLWHRAVVTRIAEVVNEPSFSV